MVKNCLRFLTVPYFLSKSDKEKITHYYSFLQKLGDEKVILKLIFKINNFMTEIVLVSLAVKGIFISGGINIRILPEIIPRCRNNTAKFCHRRFYRNRHYRRDETSLD